MVKDSLSALLDGECSGSELDRLLEQLDRSPEVGRQWSRLCLARDARAGIRVKADQPCICAGVMRLLDGVPATRPVSKVVDLAVRRAARLVRLPTVWKPAAAFAAAASMGAAAVLLTQPQLGSSPGNGGAISTQHKLAGWGPQHRVEPQPVPVPVSVQERAHTQMLREYMMDHNGAIADEDVGGALRYIRLVAHTAEYRQQPEGQP